MKQLKQFTLALLFLLIGVGVSVAQSVNAGDIRGSVTDASGALLPGVTVSVLNVDTGVTKELVTNQAGIYDTNSIVPGRYTITFKHDGFDTFVRGPITLAVGFTSVNAQLSVGSTKEQVTVNADIPLLVTETGDQSTTMDSKSMNELPQVTRDWTNLVFLIPGSTGVHSTDPGQTASVNGNLPYSNFLADGASTTLPSSQNTNTVSFENVAELQVNTSSFSAQYGVGGALFNQISKGGTSAWHGTAYDYIQNNAFTSVPRQFNDATSTVPILHYNNYGGSVSGPIPVNHWGLNKKAFFYFNIDRTVKNSSSVSTSSIPTDAIQSGDFSDITATLYDPTTQTIATDSAGNKYPVRKTFKEEYGSNKIPTALLDAVSAKFQKFYPNTTSHISNGTYVTGGTGSHGQTINNFVSSVPSTDPLHKFFGRFDYDLTPTNRITMSDTQSDEPAFYPSSIAVQPIGWETGDVDNNNAQITDVWTINSKMVNEARIGYTTQLNFFADEALGKGYPTQLGWQFSKADTIPAIEFYDGDWNYSWITPSTNAVYKEHVFDPSDVVTLITGKHILHFGGEVLIYQDNSTAWGNTNAGTMEFGSAGAGTNNNYTANWTLNSDGVASIDSSTGWAYADFLLGYVNTWNAAVTPEYGGRLKSPQIFIQDDYKIRPNLTLNLGLRYQINHGWSEVDGNIDSFDRTVKNSDGTLGAMWYASSHANGRKQLQEDTYDTLLPRVGFSWLYDPKTTVRGGFGVYAYNMSLDGYGQGMGAPFGQSGNAQDTTYGITPIVKLDGTGHEITPVTGGTSTTALPYTSASTSVSRFNGQEVTENPYHTPVPKIYQWNVAVQRELRGNIVAEVSYVASHGFNLAFPSNQNQIPESKILSTKVNTAAIPYANFTQIDGHPHNAISNYHSLQAQLTKRMSSGLSFNFNYVWSHFLDDQDSSGYGGAAGAQDYQNSYDTKANYGASNFDVRHAFKGNAVYHLPFGKGQQFLSKNRALDAAVGGWELSGSIVLQTGNPFTVISNQTKYNNGGGGPYPNWSGKSKYASHKGAKTWYNPEAFTRPAEGAYGKVRRNSLYGPGLELINLSAHKEFLLTNAWNHDFRMQFRAEATNAFNHPNLGQPNVYLAGDSGAGTQYTTTNNGTSGQITSVIYDSNVQRNLQLSLRLSF